MTRNFDRDRIAELEREIEIIRNIKTEEIKCPNCVAVLKERISELESDIGHLSKQKADGLDRIEQLTSECIEKDNEIATLKEHIKLMIRCDNCETCQICGTEDHECIEDFPSGCKFCRTCVNHSNWHGIWERRDRDGRNKVS